MADGIIDFLLSPTMLLLFWPAILAALLLAVLFVPKYRLAPLPAAHEQVLAHLAYRLRLAGHDVIEETGKLTVRTGSYARVKFSSKVGRDGSHWITFQPDLTKSGWGTMIFLLVSLFMGLIALGMAVYFFLRARQFARRGVVPLLPGATARTPGPPTDEVGVLLVTGLSEAHRLARDAYEAGRSAYWDSQGVIALAGVFAWFFLFATLLWTWPDPSFEARLRAAFAASTVLAVALTVPPALVLRRRRRPELLRIRAEAERLAGAVRREASPALSAEGGPSAFEILAEASQEVPGWLLATQRAGMSWDAPAGLLVVLLGLSGIEFAWWAVSLASAGLWLLAALTGLGGFGLLAGLAAFYRRWQRAQAERAALALAQWNERIGQLRARMDRFLQDL